MISEPLYSLIDDEKEAAVCKNSDGDSGCTKLYPLFRGGVWADHQQIETLIHQASENQSPVTLAGGAGTEKDQIAMRIHAKSSRAMQPFVEFAFSAAAEHQVELDLFGYEDAAGNSLNQSRLGLLELARQGTLFLEDIDRASLYIQTKLITVMREKRFLKPGSGRVIQVDVRFIAATSRDFEAEVEAGRFRKDLYYKLNVQSIQLPQLHQRQNEIPQMIYAFVKRFNIENKKKVKFISAEALNYLVTHPWPDNMDQLKNVLERACVQCKESTLTLDLFGRGDEFCLPLIAPNLSSERFTLPQTVEFIEKRLIIDAMRKTKGIQRSASKMLGITERMLVYKLKKYNLAALREQLRNHFPPQNNQK